MGRITFLLPSRGNTPVGGFKVVYEYANRFAADGYVTTLVYPATLPLKRQSVCDFIRMLLRFLKLNQRCHYSGNSWFKLHPEVIEKWVPSFDFIFFDKEEIIVASACETAWWLINNKKVVRNKKFYLIQHYENWVDNEILVKTWKSGLHKIVIADWLYRIGSDFGVKTDLIENGLDHQSFYLKVNITDRINTSVCMLWHISENKGSNDGLKALIQVKKEIPDLKCTFFGVHSRPDMLPDWIDYYQKPSQDLLSNIYNSSSIFVAPSHTEGFGLTAAEAMQCGCAVAATDAGGFKQFCIENETALISPAKDIDALKKNIIKLITDCDFRYRIANCGNQNIKRFDWQQSYQKFNVLISGV